MEDLEMLHGALNLVNVNAGLKPTERALIVCDTDNISIAKVLAYAVKSVGAEYSICIMEPRSTHGEDPTEAISKAMLGADVIFAPTRFSLSHSNARIKANENGARFISMPRRSAAMCMSGGCSTAAASALTKWRSSSGRNRRPHPPSREKTAGISICS